MEAEGVLLTLSAVYYGEMTTPALGSPRLRSAESHIDAVSGGYSLISLLHLPMGEGGGTERAE